MNQPPRKPEPAAESPVETAEDEIADKAEELNIELTVAEPAALDPTKRRLELWKQSTSRKLVVQVQPNRVCSMLPSVQTTVCEKGASVVTAARSPGRKFAVPWKPAPQMQSSRCARQSRREALMSQWRNAQTSRTA